jgi:hypothetical protein
MKFLCCCLTAVLCSTNDSELCSRLLTIVIVTNAAGSAPDISMFVDGFQHLKDIACLNAARVLVGLHVNPDDRSLKSSRYEHNIRTWHMKHITTSRLVVSYIRNIEASFVNFLSLVNTKYYLFWEHDWRFCRHVPIARIIHLMEYRQPAINYIRFNKDTNIVGTGLYDAVLIPCQTCGRVPLLFTPSWSNNPHVARYSFFTETVKPPLEKNASASTSYGFFEWPTTLAIAQFMEQHGVNKTTLDWGTFLYGKLNDSRMVYHIDGANTLDFTTVKVKEEYCS